MFEFLLVTKRVSGRPGVTMYHEGKRKSPRDLNSVETCIAHLPGLTKETTVYY